MGIVQAPLLVHDDASALKLHWCRMPALGLTLAYVFGDGLITVRETSTSRR